MRRLSLILFARKIPRATDWRHDTEDNIVKLEVMEKKKRNKKERFPNANEVRGPTESLA